MKNLPLLKKDLIKIGLCAGFMVLPFAAHADVAAEVSTAAKHAGMSAASDALPMAHAHLHHVVNCLVGPDGKGYDQKAENPCTGQGNGAIPDTSDAAQKKMLERAVARASAGLKSDDLATVKKDATRVQTALEAFKP